MGRVVQPLFFFHSHCPELAMHSSLDRNWHEVLLGSGPPTEPSLPPSATHPFFMSYRHPVVLFVHSLRASASHLLPPPGVGAVGGRVVTTTRLSKSSPELGELSPSPKEMATTSSPLPPLESLEPLAEPRLEVACAGSAARHSAGFQPNQLRQHPS